MKIVETIASGLRSLGVSVLDGFFVSPLSKSPTISLIGDSKNLNDYMISGVFFQDSDAKARNGENYPYPFSGILKIFSEKESSSVFQEYHVYGDVSTYPHNSIWTRTKNADTWSSWEKLSNSSETKMIHTAFYNGYLNGTQDTYWIYIGDIIFPGDNTFAEVDFLTSRGFGNGTEPTSGKITLRSGSDKNSYDYVTPTVTQTKKAIRNIQLYSVGGNNLHKRIFVQLTSYTSFHTTGYSVDKWGTRYIPLWDGSPRQNVADAGRYPSNIYTIGE